MAKLKKLTDLLLLELADLYDAERQLAAALPRLARASGDGELRQGFIDHLAQTREHIARIERAFALLGATPRSKPCHAMRRLLEESDELLRGERPSALRDAALIAAAQKVEHYEIASYGSARTYAEILAHEDLAELLQDTLEEEDEADKRLTDIAESINEEAEAISGDV